MATTIATETRIPFDTPVPATGFPATGFPVTGFPVTGVAIL